MRRSAAVLLLAALAVAVAVAAPAGAHPLGNFSVNHLDVVRISGDRVDVRYVLDQAEIPTFQERDLSPAQVLARKRAVVARGVTLTVGGRRVALRLAPGGRITYPMGQGGLHTTRVELLLSARTRVRGAVVLDDATYPGRVGWRAVVVRPGAGTAVRSDLPSADPTHGLRVYPTALLSTPAHRPVAHLTVGRGDGTVVAPRLDAAGLQTTRGHPAGDGLAGVFASAAAGRGVLLFLLLAAFGWGAVHALSPGHGKAMVAAYLVGTRGTARHAVALGLTVTATHTIGVFALGLVTLALSAYVLPEDLYPWLNLASGLLVLVVGAAVLRGRVRRAQRREHAHHDHDHSHDHEHDHAHGHTHDHHHVPQTISARALVAMGASAGLLPCPSALVVLLGAIAQHQVGLGLVLIVAFSAGLAATLTGLGIAVVHAGRLTARISPDGRLVAVLPAASALVIVAAGTLLTVRALAGVLG
ncbi:MAG: nickel/cobalt transporter (NicO) family protein [Solirubrobacteraceae bacterium]|nr:nickel/cobalt transporter (NicO) family protein [Solirubrobacteraceae bacterium]